MTGRLATWADVGDVLPQRTSPHTVPLDEQTCLTSRPSPTPPPTTSHHAAPCHTPQYPAPSRCAHPAPASTLAMYAGVMHTRSFSLWQSSTARLSSSRHSQASPCTPGRFQAAAPRSQAATLLLQAAPPRCLGIQAAAPYRSLQPYALRCLHCQAAAACNPIPPGHAPTPLAPAHTPACNPTPPSCAVAPPRRPLCLLQPAAPCSKAATTGPRLQPYASRLRRRTP